MNTKLKLLVATGMMLFIGACSTTPITQQEGSGKPVEAFPITQVELLPGPFLHATELNVESLLSYEPDRLLAKFRSEAGLEPKAEHYKGWEAETIAGHTLGHHLSACALMYQSTGDQRFLDRVNYIVDELEAVQNANGNGYVGAFTNGRQIFEEQIAKGEIRSQGFDLNGIWAPFYTHHKVLAGLRDAYRLAGNEKALEIGKGFGTWIGTIVLDLNNEQVQKMLHCEFGGVQETLAQLYEDSGDEKFLEIARVFHHEDIVDPLARGEDILPNKHGNTQIPKMIASATLYELTGEEQDRRPAEFFWNTVVDHHTYVTGGHGNHEYFGQPDQLTNRLSDETTETCNVYNMLKLSRHLFQWEPSAAVADYYERALFNHILASQHPESGRVIYNLSLEMGGYKIYQNPEWFTCCVGSGMETHSKYGANIYYHNEEELYVSQYMASVLDWEEKGLKLRQETSYPEEQGSQFLLELVDDRQFTLYLRYPYWAQEGVNVTINGEAQTVEAAPGSFLAIDRSWKNGDKIRIDFPFSLRLEAMPDDEDRIAVFYGPVLLAGDLGPVEDEAAYTPEYVPVFMSEERSPEAWLEAVPGEVNTFKSKEVGKPRDIVFKPFYKTHDRRYSVYFDLFNQQRWEERQAEYQAELERKKQLESITYDAFQPGEMQAERNHNFRGDKLNIMEDFKGRKARGSERGGWLAFDMKVEQGTPMALNLEYWGGFTGSKTFDILINDQKVATENISGKQDGAFIDVNYDIPTEITDATDKITVKFEPHVGHRSGPFFYARTVRKREDPQ
ncbi:glycoside hydrolase family 127 protein [Flavilitoribacter nigricans]|uniref:Glycosyl hydrolase n=1 Tax=Flavilitoribacter nigricans (strain ATCC 23147 / DSM 23189 / NBRC 102662 / NCIMB 1420 / SS-2) TaxID=1122177 RepID=A0A2D0N6J9_FLAN2|nr:glycoside hydrolase family 127 protein [Flavilitoribacter nigricans]PHN04141.1 glycosyl hydrolase [Flavilitoribacter nigricans DSM 23189 = NBRC 102662]